MVGVNVQTFDRKISGHDSLTVSEHAQYLDAAELSTSADHSWKFLF